MKTRLVAGRSLAGLGALVFVFSALAACGTGAKSGAPEPPDQIGAGGSAGGGSSSGEGGDGGDTFDPAPDCNAAIAVNSNGRSLVVTDPEVLSRFSLERVLQKLLDSPDSAGITPLHAIQELFDTENTVAGSVFPSGFQCDAEPNPAFMIAPAANCPRVEGNLAKDDTLLTPGNPNAFVPVAIVNRFDLTRQSAMMCGEYRIVYAKESGKTNPDDRVFLIFEGMLPNPTVGSVMGCLPVARFWAGLGQETDVQVVAEKLDTFFFTGLPTFEPLVHPLHFGAMSDDGDSYGGSKGQVRLGQKMQDPWEWREFRFAQGMFVPATTKNNPIPERFDTAATPADGWFRQEFLFTSVQALAASELHGIRMKTPAKSNMGQSAFAGVADVDYITKGSAQPGTDYATEIDAYLLGLNLVDTCPVDDPLTGKSILQRATMQTCAGCHAPQQFLEANNSIGCGLTWPASLGEVHISETGELSPALKDVFLPRRAEVLETFAQACDTAAIDQNLMPAEDGDLPLPK